MVIGFNPQFVPKILSGKKIHTIREDVHDRWKEGNIMHMATGVRTPHYDCFQIDRCTGVQRILLDTYHEQIGIKVEAFVHLLTEQQQLNLILNDGFDKEKDFWEWFKKPHRKPPEKLIHWTDLRY